MYVPDNPHRVANTVPRQQLTPSLLACAQNTVRTKRVREARDEAKKEIDAYKAEKEAEYKQFESEVGCHSPPPQQKLNPGHRVADRNHETQHTQGNKAAEEEANKEAEAKIKEIRAAGQKNQDKVVQDLLKAVFEAKPEPPSEVAA